MAIRDGRQWGAVLDDIARNHVERYRFAAGWMRDHFPGRSLRVLDVGCGCGYGTNVLASAGAVVLGVDLHGPSIDFARQNWAHGRARFQLRSVMPDIGAFDLAVALEVVEHVTDGHGFMCSLAKLAPIVIASVPNEEVQSFSTTRHPDHKRHYTPGEFTALFNDCGLDVREYWHQASRDDYRVVPGTDGGTIIYVGWRLHQSR